MMFSHSYMIKLICRLFFNSIHVLLIIIPRSLKYMFNFCYRNYREELREQEVTSKEQSEGPYVKSNFPDSWAVIHAPATGHIVAVNGCNDDHKPLKPHP